MFQRFILSILAGAAVVNGFSGTLFQEHTAKQIKTPCVQPGIEIELPDFDELLFVLLVNSVIMLLNSVTF